MPLHDHFRPPLSQSRRWEGFHHAWASNIAQHLNLEVLPTEYFAEAEISAGPAVEIDVAAFEEQQKSASRSGGAATAVWAPTTPALSFQVDFAHLEVCEVRVYENLGGPQLRAAIELVSPANKDRPGSRRTFAAKCAGYLKQAVAVVLVDVVTERSANLHAELCDALDVGEATWDSPTQLYAIAYRPIPVPGKQRVEMWPERLALGSTLPTLPLWLSPDVCFPLALEETYATTCAGLRIE